MGGREKSLEAQAKDGLASAEGTLQKAAEKTKQGAEKAMEKTEQLGASVKAQAEKLTK